MTPKALLILCAGLFLPLAGAGAQESLTLRKISETGIVTVGFRDMSIPFSYLDRRQKPIGYSIDICFHIVDAVKARLGMPNIEIKFVPVNSASRFSFVAADIVDLECGTTTNNTERQKAVAFTTTTFVVSNSLVAKKSANIRTLDDLRGRTVASTAGATSLAALTQLNRSHDMGMQIVAGKDHAEAFQMVANDRAAAFVLDDVLLYGQVANAKNPSAYAVVPTGLPIEPYGIGIRKGDKQFKKLADEAIVALFKSGEINNIYKKWFQSPIPPNQVNLDFPMSREFKHLIANPTDSPDPADYR